jgi:phosphatidylglycerophosphate synthase
MKMPRLPEGEIDTTANVITLIGGALVAKGIQKGVDTPAGLALICLGRACDLVDGPWARAHDEVTDLGTALDPTVDKIGCAAVALSMWRKKIVPTPVFTGMAVQNIANGIATTRAQKAHPEENFLPSKKGKFAMFFQNLGLVSYDYSHIMAKKAEKHAASEVPDPAEIVKYQRLAQRSCLAGHAASLVGVVVLGVPATRGYFKRI